MHKFMKEYHKAQKIAEEIEDEPLSEISNMNIMHLPANVTRKDRELSMAEKTFLLGAERGDIVTVKKFLEEADEIDKQERFSINAVDPLGRSALLIAIEYENIEMIDLLLSYRVECGEALLHAIDEEFVEAVELLLRYQDQENMLDQSMQSQSLSESKIVRRIGNSGFKSKWSFLLQAIVNTRTDKAKKPESNVNPASKSFTADITPLILASHKDNYEIIKILLDRGEQIPEPHDVRCSCAECIKARSEDSLRYSKSRINAYRALASPSLISLSSKDPILTAFQLSWELKRLSRIENEFKNDYEKLSQQCQEYASALLAETRTSKELEIILNHDNENPPALFEDEVEKTSLSRLKLAIKYKQKKFVAHPHCQQLLVSLCKVGKILRQPFIKFICHSASYVFFLLLLILASLRIRDPDSEDVSHKEKRGTPPTHVEWVIYLYIASFVWSEIKQLYNEGLIEYLHDWWNLLDFITNTLYISTIVLKFISFMIVQNEISNNDRNHELRREKWDAWDPTLISEGVFACANIFSSLKLVYIFTINPHLGPLQISLGRMIFDIMKFTCLILLVIFSFGCGLNQLYGYYAHMKGIQCLDEIDPELKEECVLKVKYFSNLFETLQTLYWGTFGLVEKDRLDSLHRKHTFTMFIGLLMFGVYSTIMIIVLVNMLIAMMSNSYQIIANQADEEWKFARSRLWVSYFEEGGTLPAPFCLIPSPKSLYYIIRYIYRKFSCLKKLKRKQQRWLSIRKIMKKIGEREYKYQSVIKELVKRYIMKKQQRDQNAGVTEDDLNEIKQDISGFRFELLDILKKNDYKIDAYKQSHGGKRGKRGKLNLEKAISKNMFDPAKRGQPMFDAGALAFNTIDKKGSKKSESSRTSGVPASTIMIQETLSSSKLKSPTSPGSSESQSQNQQPSMYKIAMKLKKLTEPKLKKTMSEDASIMLTPKATRGMFMTRSIDAPRSPTILENIDELTAQRKKSTTPPSTPILSAPRNIQVDEDDKIMDTGSLDSLKKPLRRDDSIDFSIDLEETIIDSDSAPKASPDHMNDDPSFTERITEV